MNAAYRSMVTGMIGLVLGLLLGRNHESSVSPLHPVAPVERSVPSIASTPKLPAIDLNIRSEAFDRNRSQADLIDAYTRWSTAELKRHILELEKDNHARTDENRFMVQIALECLAEKDPENFLYWIANNYPGDVAQPAVENAIVRVGDADPEASFAHLKTLPWSVRREASEALTFSLVGGVSSVDEIPRSWFKALMPRVVADAIGKVWGLRAPDGVIALARDSWSSVIEHGVRAAITESWAFNDPDGAIAYLDSPSKDHATTQAYRRDFAEALARFDPARAADYATTHGFMNAHTGSFIYFGWIQGDVEGALNAATNIELPSLKSWIYGRAAEHYAAREPERSIELLQSIESTTRRRQGFTEVAETIAQVQPKQVAAVASTIASDFDRAVFLRGAVGGWKAEKIQWNRVDLTWMQDLDESSRSILEQAIRLHAPNLDAT